MEQVLLGLIWFMIIVGGLVAIALPILMIVAQRKMRQASPPDQGETGIRSDTR